MVIQVSFLKYSPRFTLLCDKFQYHLLFYIFLFYFLFLQKNRRCQSLHPSPFAPLLYLLPGARIPGDGKVLLHDNPPALLSGRHQNLCSSACIIRAIAFFIFSAYRKNLNIPKLIIHLGAMLLKTLNTGNRTKKGSRRRASQSFRKA